MALAQPGTTFATSVDGLPSGLATVGFRILGFDGTTQTARTTTGVSELLAGSGIYAITALQAPSTAGHYLIVADSGSIAAGTTSTDDLYVSAFFGPRGEPTDVAVSSRMPVGAQITVAPVQDPLSGSVTLVSGDDYTVAEGRQLTFTDSSGAWPVLTGAAISLHVLSGQSVTPLLSAAGSVVTGTGTTKTVQVPLTHSETVVLKPGVYTYQVAATLSNGDVETLADGRLTVENA